MRLEKWSQMMGCLTEEEKEREAWMLKRRGWKSYSELEFGSTLRVMPTVEKGKPLVTDGEVEGEFLPREGKRVREAEGGSRLEE
ncbi:hypothetical protein CK203_029006 [Vitis vinifera]|nr:hypothetical protein CK203_029006 [Vitis vinifera]